MAARKINTNKKYPIAPLQMQTDRSFCYYCPNAESNYGSSAITEPVDNNNTYPKIDNDNKCAECGIGSRDFIFGNLVGLARKTNAPMAIVEKVNCKAYTNGVHATDKTYREINGNVYHLINLSSKNAKCITLGFCCHHRRDKKNDWLDNWCISHDIEHTIKAITAVESDNDNFFIPFPNKENMSFEYYVYRCKISLMYEVIIPIYAGYGKKGIKRSEMGLMGILIIGQLALNTRPPSIDDEVDIPVEELKCLECINGDKTIIDDEKSNTIKNLRGDKAIKHAKTDGRHFTDIESAMRKFTQDIETYMRKNRQRVILRTSDFFSVYQARLIRQYWEERPNVTDVNAVEKLKTCVMNLFKQIYKDFYIKNMFIFFPNINIKLSDDSSVVYGKRVQQDNDKDLTNYLSVSVDVSKIPVSVESKELSDIVTSGCLNGSVRNDSNAIVPLSAEQLLNGKFDFYATTGGHVSSNTFFAVFFEWEKKPPLYDSDENRHSSLFRTLMAVCFGDIMAHIANKHSERIWAFADETRHDWAQRLQTMNNQNKSFRKDIHNFEQGFPQSNKAVRSFVDHCKTYFNDNCNVHDALEFLNDVLDHKGLEYTYDPQSFKPYTEVLVRFNQHYNASWHPLNMRHKLIIRPDYFESDLYADKVMFERIMMNLLDNAFKHSPMGTNIYVQQRYDATNCYFDVINFALNGISKSMETTIFENKARGVEAEARKSNRGKGLGLYIAQEFARAHKGVISIESGIVPWHESDLEHPDIISYTNFTFYYLLKKLISNEEWRSEFQGLYDESEKVVHELKKTIKEEHPLQVSCKTFGKDNLFDFVMSERKYINYDMTARRIRRIQQKPLYMVKFTLKLPKN